MQLLVIHVRTCNEETGFQAMQNVFKLVNKIKESYIGIRFWQLAGQCPLHDNQCVGLVDMTGLLTCLTTNELLASTTVKQLRVACGLDLANGLEDFID
jgi:hypothetical protein